ncbi:unnamed protein product [Rotaria sp. Silwood1]|nr:unnamed protein product [Rotaria sp. Silwood1]
MAFDKDYKLCGYEGQIRNFGLTFDPSTDVERQGTIYLICNVTQTFCFGTLQQYSSVDECEQYLMTNVSYGSYDRGDQGNVAFILKYFTRQNKMKLSFCQLFLFLFIIINVFQCQNCFTLYKNIHEKLYNATQRMLSSLLFPVCAQILLDQNNIQSQYISPKGLSGRVIPAGTFPTKILALEYLYGLQCSIPNLPPRPYNIQTVDLVRIAYDNEYLIMLKTK